MTPEELDQLRHEWFHNLAEEAFEPSWTSEFGALAQLPPISRLTMVLMVGVGHLLGIDDCDSSKGKFSVLGRARFFVMLRCSTPDESGKPKRSH